MIRGYRGTHYYTEMANKKRPVMGGVKIEKGTTHKALSPFIPHISKA